ncbi:MAG: cation diffusion facilitator family transporter [Candidatus Falkowbacteria bacterium]
MKTAGKLPVIAAIFGNSIVGLAKLAGFLVTGSGAMFSESIHSLADTLNQSLLLVGVERSHLKPDHDHPYGHGRERYIWALISACGIFFIGCGITVYHGIDSLIHGHEFVFNYFPVIILFTSFIIEGFTFWLAYHELKTRFPRAKWKTINKNADPTTLAVVYEDGLAVLGVLIALLSIVLAFFTGHAYWDSIGSIIIGVLLGVVAIVLINKNRHYLITKAIPHEMEDDVKEILLADPSIEKIYDFKSAIFDADRYLIKCEVEFNASALMKEMNKYHFLSDKYDEVQGDREEFNKFCVEYLDRVPRLVGKKIDEIEKKIKERFPQIVFIDIEIN